MYHTHISHIPISQRCHPPSRGARWGLFDAAPSSLQPEPGENGSLEEMEEDIGLKKRKGDHHGDKGVQAGQETGEKVKRKRGRPPAEKLPPNPPELTRKLSTLVDMVTNYKDG